MAVGIVAPVFATRGTVGTRRRPALRPNAAGPLAQSMLDLQRQAGNAAVASVLSRQTPTATATAPAGGRFRPVTDFDTMTLGQFNDYANQEADWAHDHSLPSARRRTLIDVLAFGRGGTPPPLGPCEGLPVADLESHLDAASKTKLRTYARGVRAEETAGIPSTAVTADALHEGESLAALEAGIPRPILHLNMGTTDAGKTQFSALVAAGQIPQFVSYYRRAHPRFEADNGADVASYLKMVSTDGVQPESFVGRLSHVRNYHRFLAPMLETLVGNTGDTSRRRPLLLILHSGQDHNGAFHRDDELMHTVQHPRNLTILVEGASSLEEAGGDAEAIARRYGQHGRIEQVMLAGHGGPHIMELAGGGPSGNIDTEHNRARTERFLRRLIGSMATGPDARIVLNACLTAADEVSANLPTDPTAARAAILASLRGDPSLAGRIQQLAGSGRTVEGNVSSVPAGTYMATDASGNPTGVLHQNIPSDPYAASTNRGDYIEHGVEPEGAMRAVVALWALDRTECLRRVGLRRGQPISGWGDLVIHTFYDLVAAAPDNVEFMNRIANAAARGLSEFSLVTEQKPDTIAGLDYQFNAAEEGSILRPLVAAGLLPTTGLLALSQVWMNQEPAQRPIFLSTLDTFPTTEAASTHLDPAWVGDHSAELLPVATASSPSTAQAKLALWAVTGGRSDAAAVAFLRAGARGGHLAMPAGTTVDSLTASAATEDDVLRAVGLLGASTTPTTSGGPAPNVDLDGDGVNDFYVESITRTGAVSASWLNVRARPGLASAVLDVIPAGTVVYVFGRSGGWYAIERPVGAGFVHHSWVRLTS